MATGVMLSILLRRCSTSQVPNTSHTHNKQPLAAVCRNLLPLGRCRQLSTGDGGVGRASTGEEIILLSRPAKHVAHLELNRPRVRNAFSLDSAKRLGHLLGELEADPTVRCLVLSGVGTDFTSGVDLKSFMGLYGELEATQDVAHRAKLIRGVVESFQAPFKLMHSSVSKPIIAVLHGLCYGLGIELAACSDIRVSSRDAQLAIREVLLGIAADVGSLQLLPRMAADQGLLRELLYTGRVMSLEESRALGLVSRVYDTKPLALEAALELASQIARNSPVAVQGAKRNLLFSQDKPLLVGLDYNAVWNAAMMQGDDIKRAVGSILSKDDDVTYEDV